MSGDLFIDSKKFLSMVEESFDEGGPLSKQFPPGVYKRHNYQVSYAMEAAENMMAGYPQNVNSAPISLLEAETGCGKTLGYLIPAAIYSQMTGRKVVISTFTLHLMHQIAQSQIQIALNVCKELTGNEPSWAIRKGWRNYISPEILYEIANKLTGDSALEVERIAIEIEDQYKSAPEEIRITKGLDIPGDIAQWKEENGPLPDGLTEDAICYQSYDPKSIGGPVLRKYINASSNASIVITTHAMTILNALCWSTIISGVGVLVIDEADRLPAAAENVLGGLISVRNITSAIKVLASEFNEVATFVDKTANIAADMISMRDNLDASVTQDSKGSYIIVDDMGEKYKSSIRSMATSLEAIIKGVFANADGDAVRKNSDLAEAGAYLSGIASRAQDFVKCCDGSGGGQIASVHWSPIKEMPALRLMNMYPARILSRMWKPQKDENGDPIESLSNSIILTSATLGSPGKSVTNNDMRIELGLYEGIGGCNIIARRNFEPSIFGEIKKIVLADPSVNSPTLRIDEFTYETDPEWLEYACLMIRHAKREGGRTLVLALSYNNAEAIGELVKDAIIHRPGTKIGTVIDEFKESRNTVLVTPAGWEGLDLPGLIDNLVITRLPFMPVESVLLKARIRSLIAKGIPEEKAKGMQFGVTLNYARRKFKQGFGRGIRQRTDRVSVWIADPRFPPTKEVAFEMEDAGMDTSSCKTFQSFHQCIPHRFRDGEDSPLNMPHILTKAGDMLIVGVDNE